MGMESISIWVEIKLILIYISLNKNSNVSVAHYFQINFDGVRFLHHIFCHLRNDDVVVIGIPE